MHTRSHQSHTVEQIEIGDDLRLFLLPTNVFIPTPFRMEAELLRAFRDRKRQVLLLHRRNRQILLATLDALHDTFLVAYTRQDVLATTQCGDDIMVFFPTMSHHHYILKTRIGNLSCNRFTLYYQEPRADVRWSFPVSLPVLCSLAPPALVGALRYTRIAREITTQSDGQQGSRIGQVTDLICESNSVATSALMQTFQESRTLACGLRDIALGGVGLTLDDTHDLEEFDHRLVRLQILLPQATPGSLDQESPGIFLRPLGIIRQFRTTRQPWTLHIQFLAPLPEEFNTCFAEVTELLGGSHVRIRRVDDLGVTQRDAARS